MFVAKLVALAAILPASASASGLRVGLWNVLNTEYNPDYGQPYQIDLCQGKEDQCTLERRERLWEVIESYSETLDVLTVQEADDPFYAVQGADSMWTLVQRSNSCGVMVSSNAQLEVLEGLNIALPRLSSCGPEVPAIVVSGEATMGYPVAVASLHVSAGLPDITPWYATTAETFESTLPGMPHILAGDYNKNLTAAQIVPEGWELGFAEGIPVIGGTSQKELNTMGNIDGFFLSTSSEEAGSDLIASDMFALVKGFMPKVGVNLPLSGVIQETAQFDVTEDYTLLFSNSSMAPFVPVPDSNQATESLSDHLLVTGTFSFAETSSVKCRRRRRQ